MPCLGMSVARCHWNLASLSGGEESGGGGGGGGGGEYQYM